MRRQIAAALALGLALAAPAAARADVFAFTDLDGFEKCLETDHVVEKVTTDKGAQSRYLTQAEIQLRCIEAGAKLLAPKKSKPTDLAFIDAVARLSAPVSSLDLVAVLVDHGLDGCNEMAAYGVITEALSRPVNPSKSSVFARGQAIARRCLKDKTFQADFKEEQQKPGDLGVNACALLREEKLVASCKDRS